METVLEKIKKNKKLFFDIALILLLGLLSISWFRGENLIHGGDFGMPLDWVKYLKSMFSVWMEDYSMGRTDYRNLASLIPYAVSGALFQSLGFSLVFIEKIFFYSWFAGAGLSMYFLTNVLGMKRPGRLVSSVFYMLNPFSLVIIWRVSHGLIQMPYAFMPLLLGLFIHGLVEKKGFGYIIFFCFAWLFFTGSAYANPRSAIIHWLPIGLYFLYDFIAYKARRLFVIKFTVSLTLLWTLCNFYWIFPYLANITESNASAHSSFLMPDIEELKLTSVNVFEAIRMLGYWSLKSGYKGEPYYPYYQYYTLPFINLISWLIPILVILGFFNKTFKNEKIKFYYLAVMLFGLLGINGASPPIGNLILTFYKIFPPLILLARFNFLFFGLPTYLIFALMFGYGFLFLVDYGVSKVGKIVWLPLGLFLLLINVVLVWPFWTGEVIRSQGKLIPGERVKVPDYWLETKQWLSTQKDFFRILPLPMSKTYNTAFFWGEGFSGGDLTRWLTSQPVLNVNTEDTFQMPLVIGEAIEKASQAKDLAKLLGYANTKYVLVRHDTRWDFLRWHDASFNHEEENIRFFLENGGFGLSKKIGELEFYQVPEKYVVPRVYAPDSVVTIDGEIKGLLDLAVFLSPEKKQAFVFTEDKPSANPDFLWRMPKTVNNADYEFSLAEDGVFEILLRNENFLKRYPEVKSLGLIVNGEKLPARNISIRKDNLLSLGEINLKVGKATITVSWPEPPDLLNGGGQPSLELVSGKQEVATLAIRDFQPGEQVQVAFRAKNLSGLPPTVVIWQNFVDASEPIFDKPTTPFFLSELKTSYSFAELPASQDWQNYEFSASVHPLAKVFGISFLSRPPAVGKTENHFTGLTIQPVFNNPLILRNTKEVGRQATPALAFQKISPTKYKIDVQGTKEPFRLIFSEAFHSGWKINLEAKQTIINGFANSWLIEKTGDYEIIIFFDRQKFLYLGVAVSLTTLLLSLLYLIVRKKK